MRERGTARPIAAGIFGGGLLLCVVLPCVVVLTTSAAKALTERKDGEQPLLLLVAMVTVPLTIYALAAAYHCFLGRKGGVIMGLFPMVLLVLPVSFAPGVVLGVLGIVFGILFVLTLIAIGFFALTGESQPALQISIKPASRGTSISVAAPVQGAATRTHSSVS